MTTQGNNPGDFYFIDVNKDLEETFIKKENIEPSIREEQILKKDIEETLIKKENIDVMTKEELEEHIINKEVDDKIFQGNLELSVKNEYTDSIINEEEFQQMMTDEQEIYCDLLAEQTPHLNEMEIIIIPTPANKTYFVDKNDHIYSIYKKRNVQLQFRCICQRRRHKECHAFARAFAVYHSEQIVRVTGFKLTQPHSHDSDMGSVQELRLRRICFMRAMSESNSYLDIFNSEVTRYPLAHLTFRAVRRGMERLRKPNIPRNPLDLGDFGRLLENSILFQCDQEKLPFFRQCLQENDSVSFVFVAEAFLYTLYGGHFHADSAFKCVPMGLIQMLTIHVLQYDCSYSVIYVLMNKRTKEAYKLVLQYLKEKFNFMPVSVTSDFETELQEAFIETFPNVELIGCLFNFCEKIIYKARNDLGVDFSLLDIKMIKFFHMICAIPLLPQQLIEEGIKATKIYTQSIKSTEKEQQIIEGMLSYVSGTWLVQISPSIWSVYRRLKFTTNVVKTFNGILNFILGTEDPGYWLFLIKLGTFSHRNTIELRNAEDNEYIRVSNWKKRQRRNLFFSRLWNRLPAQPLQHQYIQFLSLGGLLTAGGLKMITDPINYNKCRITDYSSLVGSGPQDVAMDALEGTCD